MLTTNTTIHKEWKGLLRCDWSAGNEYWKAIQCFLILNKPTDRPTDQHSLPRSRQNTVERHKAIPPPEDWDWGREQTEWLTANKLESSFATPIYTLRQSRLHLFWAEKVFVPSFFLVRGCVRIWRTKSTWERERERERSTLHPHVIKNGGGLSPQRPRCHCHSLFVESAWWTPPSRWCSPWVLNRATEGGFGTEAHKDSGVVLLDFIVGVKKHTHWN